MEMETCGAASRREWEVVAVFMVEEAIVDVDGLGRGIAIGSVGEDGPPDLFLPEMTDAAFAMKLIRLVPPGDIGASSSSTR